MLGQKRDDDEIVAEHMNRFVGAVADRTTLKRYFALFLGLNIALWGATILISIYQSWALVRIFSQGPKRGAIFLLAIPFGLGLLTTYLVIRLILPDIENVEIDSEFMSGYSYSRMSQRRWHAWLGAVVGGFINLLAMVFAVIYLISGF